MPYISKAKKAELQAWMETTSRLVARRNIRRDMGAAFDEDDAYGIALEAMLRAAEKSTDHAFLFRAATNAVISAIRKIACHLEIDTVEKLEETFHKGDNACRGNVIPDPKDRIAETLEALRAAELILLLPERTAQVIEMTFYDRLTEREVGERLGISREAVSQRKLRGLAKMQDYLEKNL